MVLQMWKGILDSEKADITFPTTLTKVQTEMRGLEEFGKSYGVVRSVSGEGLAQLLNGRVQVDDLNTEVGIQRLNGLAGLIDNMSIEKLEQAKRTLEIEDFSQAVIASAEYAAPYLNQLISDSEREYGREALRRPGADDELLDTIDGYMDFDQLGRAIMEEDGVRQTGCGLVVTIQEHLGQHALAADLALVGAGELALAHRQLNAILEKGDVVVVDGGVGQQLVQLGVLHGGGEGAAVHEDGVIDIGADLLALELPVVGGALEVVGDVLFGQVAVVELLTQLDIVLAAVVDVGGVLVVDQAVVLGVSAGAGGVLGAVAHNDAVGLDAGGAGEAHHIGLQGVESHLCNLVTGQGGQEKERQVKNSQKAQKRPGYQKKSGAFYASIKIESRGKSRGECNGWQRLLQQELTITAACKV